MKKSCLIMVALIAILIMLSACQKEAGNFKWKPMKSTPKTMSYEAYESIEPAQNPGVITHFNEKTAKWLWVKEDFKNAYVTPTDVVNGWRYEKGDSLLCTVEDGKAYFIGVNPDDPDGDIPAENWAPLERFSFIPIKKDSGGKK